MFDPIPSPANFTSSSINPLLPPNPYSIFFDSAIGRLNVVGNSLDNHLHESISNTGYLELTLDENHFSSDPYSQYFYAGITGATKDTLTSINFDGKDGRDSLSIGNQTVRSLNIQTEDDLIISGNIFTDFLTTNADTLTVKNANITTSENNKGGTIQLLGNHVEVLNSNLNTSGNLSGGTILIGGDYQGKGQVQNAQTTFVSEDSTIQANALKSGNGGKVIIWADGDTDFRGDIKARGGAKFGDGGFVEVSGKQNLNFVGDVDVDAPKGKQGTVLLDPADIIINPDDGKKATFDISDLYKIKGNISLSASNSIVFNTDARFYSDFGGNITLQAGGAVNLLGDFSTTSSNLNISAGSINAEGDISSYSKNISLTSRDDIQTNGIYGLNISIAAGGSINTQQIYSHSHGNISLTASLGIKTAGIYSFSEFKPKGNIIIKSSSGDIQTNQIVGLNISIAAGGSINTQQIIGNDGNISLNASLGIKTTGISSFSEFNQAGNIKINTPDIFEVYTIGDYAFVESDKGDIFTFSTYGSGGNLTINAKKFISSGNIYSGTYSGQGKGGNVTIKADEVKVGLINTGTNGGGVGGNIRIDTTDDIKITNISTTSVTGNAGSVTLNASEDILTSYIDASSREVGNGGTVKLTSKSGKIDTNGQAINTSAQNGNAGSVTLNTSGDILASYIDASSKEVGNGGTVKLTSKSSKIDTNGQGIVTSAQNGNAGNVILNASSDISTSGIFAYANGNAGDIKISSISGSIDADVIDANSKTERWGDVSIKAATDIKTNYINGGTVAINSTSGSITLDNAGIQTSSAKGASASINVKSGNKIKLGKVRSNLNFDNGNAGNIKIEAVDQVSLNSSIISRSSQAFNSGNIRIISQNAGIDFTWTDNNPGISARSEGGIAGSITVEASGDITKNALDGEIRSWSENGGKAGNVKIASSNGKVLLGKTPVRAWADVNDAGKVTIEAAGDLEIGAMETYSKGAGNAGDIYISSSYGNIISGYIRSDSVKGNSGDITLNAFAENGGGGGGTVRVIGSVNLDGVNFSIFAGISGSPLLKISHGGVLVGGGNFIIGDATVNGTAGIIMAGGDVIIDTSEIKGIYTLGNIKINTFTLIDDDPTLKEIKKRVQKSFSEVYNPIKIDIIARELTDRTGIPALVSYVPELKRLWASKELAVEAAYKDPKLKGDKLLAASTVLFDIKRLLDSSQKYGVTDRAQIAYILATVSHETQFGTIGLSAYPSPNPKADIFNHNPMFEYGGYRTFGSPEEQSYFNNFYINQFGNGNSASGDGYKYRGRGYVQITWKNNYEKIGNLFSIDLKNNPDKAALDRNLASDIAVRGMKEGLFTGYGFNKIFYQFNGNTYETFSISVSENAPNFYQARKIVNALIEATAVEGQAYLYLKTLNEIKYNLI